MESSWDEAVRELRAEMEDGVWEAWVSPLRFVRKDGATVVVEVPNKYFGDYFEENFKGLVCQKLGAITGEPSDLSFVLSRNGQSQPIRPQEDEDLDDYRINEHQTFDSYVIGESNQFAHAAAINVATNPGKNYNPLFIFGGVGIGKTHLLNAIGNQVMAQDPAMRVLYLSAEQFVNDMVSSLRHKRMERFRTRYRQRCNVLLVDDIHFLGAKNLSQNEFFHTFNALHAAARQIVVTSDRYPRDMEEMEERLRTRFEWGLIADIQPPELETRVAILHKKAEVEGLELPEDVAFFVASNVQSNVRELEGVLKRLQAFSAFYGRAITLDFAKTVLRDFTESIESRLTMERVQETTAKFFNIQVKDLKSPRRNKFISRPRQIAMFLCREHTAHSFPEIGAAFGKRHHTTVMHACGTIRKELERDADLRSKLAGLERALRV
jgi:chromosomal replication initiator protein